MLDILSGAFSVISQLYVCYRVHLSHLSSFLRSCYRFVVPNLSINIVGSKFNDFFWKKSIHFTKSKKLNCQKMSKNGKTTLDFLEWKFLESLDRVEIISAWITKLYVAWANFARCIALVLVSSPHRNTVKYPEIPRNIAKYSEI